MLGSPDNQALYDEAQAYDDLIDEASALALGDLTFVPERIPPLPDGTELIGDDIAESEAWLLALDGHWFRCSVTCRLGRAGPPILSIGDAAEDIRGGMSGSPVLSPDGRAIGVVSHSFGDVGVGGRNREGASFYLRACLPNWLTGHGEPEDGA